MFSASAKLQNKTGFLFPACSSKHHKFSARPPTQQSAARAAAPLCSDTSHARGSAGQIPVGAFLSPTLGPELPRSAAAARRFRSMSPESLYCGHTDDGSHKTLMIIFLASLADVGLELASLCCLPSRTGWTVELSPASHPIWMSRLSGGCSPCDNGRGTSRQQRL